MNCRGLGEQRKRRDVMHYIRNKKFDIVLLQDTHLTVKSIPFFNTLWKGSSFHSCHSSRSRGTSILFNSRLQHTFLTEKASECGNYHMVACKIQNESFLFVSVYGPNEDKPEFYGELENKISEFNVDFIIVGGDFNFVLNKNMDSLNYVAEHNIRAKQVFLDLTVKHGLMDVWRLTHPDDRQYTWMRKTPMKAGRLDMFFVSDDLVNSFSDIEIIPGYRTDHNIITLSIQRGQRRGSGLWKFNVSHLSDNTYFERIRSCISDTLKQYSVPVYSESVYNDNKFYDSIQLTINECTFYETLIMMIRGETIRYSKQKARRKRITEARLESEIAEAQDKYVTTNCQSDLTRLSTLQEELEELRRPMIDGLIMRSRVAWHEQGERSSKYFLSLEKRNANKKCIQYIEDGGIIISKTEHILEKFSNNIQKRYNYNESILPDCSFVKNHVSKRLSTEDKDNLDADLSMSELSSALSTMRKGKTPGSNGFPVEFFRVFWLDIGPFLHRAITASFVGKGELRSHQEGIITLIPKKGKSPFSYKGWRPITLLNTDYKIISTAISNRLKKVMTKVVHPAQTAYTSGRYIGENTRLLYDIIHWANKNNKTGVVLAADFEAAFESVAWSYLEMVFDEMNFGKIFKQKICHLYLNRKNYSRILLNGYLGKEIHLNRGIRQGDPASGYLFNLAVCVLTEQILKSNRLRGIKISPSQEVRISQYADDTILFLDGSEGTISGAVEELTKFSQQSGLGINLEKTSCMAIGSSPQNQTHEVLQFVDELTILGIKIGRHLKDVTDNNIQTKLPIIKKDLEHWKRRNLSPIGKICIIKTLLLSKLVHLFIALPNPSKQYIKDIEKLLFNFVWGGKIDKIKRTKLIQPPDKDGLSMVHIDSFINSMKLTWLKRLYASRSDWVVLAKHELPALESLLCFGAEKLNKIRNNVSNPFYTDLLCALIKFAKEHKASEEQILTDKIWFSNWTKFETTIIKSWDNMGLRFIGDLYDINTGRIYSKQEIEKIYGIRMTFLCYSSLRRSLPTSMQNETDKFWINKPFMPYKINLVVNHQHFAKYAYNAFVQKASENNAQSNERSKTKWIADVGEYLEGSLQKVFNATMSTFLICLHFKIVNRIYATNKYLVNIDPSQTPYCTFCNESIETIAHLFWECAKTKIFIKEILSHLKTNYQVVVENDVNKWFMLTDLSNIDILVITVAKASIHKARMSSRIMCLNNFMRSLKNEASKEYYIAKEKSKEDAFLRKWGGLSALAEIT